MKTECIINVVKTEQPWIAITFDDGPHPEYTPLLLDLFQQHGAKATFYVIGENVKQFPELAARLHQCGHELGNHTYSHPYLTKLEEQEQLAELEQTKELILGVTGSMPTTFRPPYLDMDDRVRRLCGRLGYPVIGCVNLDTEDWREPGVRHIVDTTRRHVGCGNILLFHDGFGDRSQTVEAMRILVPELIQQGYELVTVSQLLKHSSYEWSPGKA